MTTRPSGMIQYLRDLAGRRERGEDVMAELARVPTETLDEALDELLVLALPVSEHIAILHLLAADTRDYVRSQVIGQVGHLEPALAPGIGTLLWKLSVDDSRAVRQVAGAALANVLRRVDELSRLRLVCSWAGASAELRRLAVARALAFPVRSLGAMSAVEALLDDPNPAVRMAARQAAEAQKLA